MQLSANNTILSNTYIKFIIWLTLISTIFISLTSSIETVAESDLIEKEPEIILETPLEQKEASSSFSLYFEEIVPTIQQAQIETKKVVKTKKEEAEKAVRAAELAKQKAAEAAKKTTPAPSTGNTIPGAQSGDWEGRIRYWCGVYGCNASTLIKVMYCESGGKTNATNRGGSGATGLFQHMRSYWSGRAAQAGIPGASIWDGEAQIRVSTYMWTHGQASAWNASKHCWG